MQSIASGSTHNQASGIGKTFQGGVARNIASDLSGNTFGSLALLCLGATIVMAVAPYVIGATLLAKDITTTTSTETFSQLSQYTPALEKVAIRFKTGSEARYIKQFGMSSNGQLFEKAALREVIIATDGSLRRRPVTAATDSNLNITKLAFNK